MEVVSSLTFINLFLFILFARIEESSEARIGKLQEVEEEEESSAELDFEALEKNLLDKLPLLTAVLSAQYENHCRKSEIRVDSDEIEPVLEACLVTPIRRFTKKIFDTLQSSPPKAMEDTASAGMKIYQHYQMGNFQSLLLAEQNALQKQVIGPFCTFAVEILGCFQDKVQKGKLKCANWLERKTLDYMSHELGSVCYNNGSRIIQVMNLDLMKSKCVQGNQNHDLKSCYQKRGLKDEEPKSIPEFCQSITVLGDCGKEALGNCKEKEITDIVEPMFRESETWATTSCLRETTSKASGRIPSLNGFTLATLLAILIMH